MADDPKGVAALEKWLDQKDDLLAGRTPRPKGDGLTVADLANRFLTHKQSRVEGSELAPRTFARYHANCALIVETFGKSRLADDLAADGVERDDEAVGPGGRLKRNPDDPLALPIRLRKRTD